MEFEIFQICPLLMAGQVLAGFYHTIKAAGHINANIDGCCLGKVYIVKEYHFLQAKSIALHPGHLPPWLLCKV